MTNLATKSLDMVSQTPSLATTKNISSSPLQLGKKELGWLWTTRGGRPCLLSPARQEARQVPNSPSSCSKISGSAVTYGFNLASPILRETARTPSTLQRPQWMTLPPNAFIRLVSRSNSGLWSSLKATAEPSRLTIIARESPALQQTIFFPTTAHAHAVLPSKWPELTKSVSACETNLAMNWHQCNLYR